MPVRKALLDDISECISQFIWDEFGSMRGAGYCPIEIDVVVKKAEELSEKFNSLTPANKKQQIYRWLKKFQSELPLPPRPRSHPLPLNTKKIHACISEGCKNECQKKNNCPYKRIIDRSFKHIRLLINMERESLLLPMLTSTRVTSLLNILVKLFLREFYRKMMVLASTT